MDRKPLAPPKPDPLRDPGTSERMGLGFTVPNLILFIGFILALGAIAVGVACGVE